MHTKVDREQEGGRSSPGEMADKSTSRWGICWLPGFSAQGAASGGWNADSRDSYRQIIGMRAHVEVEGLVDVIQELRSSDDQQGDLRASRTSYTR